jgi:hypothetical protein
MNDLPLWFKSSWTSNIDSSVTFESRTHVHMTFMIGYDLRNKMLKHWHKVTGHSV